ncbi:MAG TPA: DUF1657 domain-containing protein [Bacillaceae bacterium]
MIKPQINETAAYMKSIKATFSELALNSADETAKQAFHECMMECEPIIKDLMQTSGIPKEERVPISEGKEHG